MHLKGFFSTVNKTPLLSILIPVMIGISFIGVAVYAAYINEENRYNITLLFYIVILLFSHNRVSNVQRKICITFHITARISALRSMVKDRGLMLVEG